MSEYTGRVIPPTEGLHDSEAEPVGVSDDLLDVATKAYAAARVEDWDRLPEAIRETAWTDFREAMRAALEAIHVLPLSVGVSDEAVEAAKRAHDRSASASHRNSLAPMRAALEAAQPFMQPQVVASRPSREQIEQRIRRIYIDGGAHITHAQEAATEIADAVLALMGGAGTDAGE